MIKEQIEKKWRFAHVMCGLYSSFIILYLDKFAAQLTKQGKYQFKDKKVLNDFLKELEAFENAVYHRFSKEYKDEYDGIKSDIEQAGYTEDEYLFATFDDILNISYPYFNSLKPKYAMFKKHFNIVPRKEDSIYPKLATSFKVG